MLLAAMIANLVSLAACNQPQAPRSFVDEASKPAKKLSYISRARVYRKK